MTDEIKLIVGEDGTASLYDDTYDITIHCENQEEQEKVRRLLKQPELCEDVVSRKTILKFLDDWMSALEDNVHNQSVSDLKIIKKDFENLPSAQPEILACGEGELNVPDINVGDMISRRAAIDALGDMVMNWTDSDYELGQLNQWKADRKAIIDLPSAQPQLDTCPIYGGMCGYPSNLCYECPRHEGAKEQPQWWTEGLQPFAQPQRMKGKWDARGWNNAYWKCSNCDELTVFPFDFCPFCGSDMRGDDDE